MKTLTIRDDVYEKLVKLKKEGESFSDLLERLLSREKVSLREFYGSLKDSKFLEELEKEILEFRKKAKAREIP
ncbi:MAG TPA: antitoxin [Thermoprotei archaeon]|nr:antitoxin [Thermoprotei archaeon]